MQLQFQPAIPTRGTKVPVARRPDGIFVAPFEQGEIGPDLFRAACGMGLKGLVSKRRDRPYQGGIPQRARVVAAGGDQIRRASALGRLGEAPGRALT